MTTSCQHQHFNAHVEIDRLTENETTDRVVAYAAVITVACRDCGEPFRWMGPSVGVLPWEPTMSVDNLELRAPCRPSSAPDDFGMSSAVRARRSLTMNDSDRLREALTTVIKALAGAKGVDKQYLSRAWDFLYPPCSAPPMPCPPVKPMELW